MPGCRVAGSGYCDPATPQPAKPGTLRIIPLGGLGEIGMNCMVYEYGGEAIVVDCGMMFPDAATLGVDVIVPDMSYIFENSARVRGVFLTHGHEDHIGAVPFLVERVQVPVYGMPLTLGFVRDKLEEFGIDDIDLREIKPRDVIEAGPFRVEAVRVTHSIIDAVGFAITTPAGTIIHTGDFKIDHTPIDGKPTDIARFAEYGERGVLALLSDSTNALVPGHCPSERVVGGALERIFTNAKGRIIVTTFASHIHRVQQVIDAARKAGRKVLLIGRSLVDNVETAERLGYIRLSARGTRQLTGHRRAPAGDHDDGHAGRAVVGALAHLDRRAQADRDREGRRRDHLRAHHPGNERAVAHVIDNLYRRGAEVVSHEYPDVHVSGPRGARKS